VEGNMAIIISKNGKNAQKIDESAFTQEDYLQKYIYNNPESLPLYEIKEDIRLLIVSREFPTNSGPIDALGIDKDGEIYIIETKLYKNPDKRLVVAQVLDYGASLWRGYNDFGEFLSIVDNQINKKFNVSLNQKLEEFFNIIDEDVSTLKENIKNNLNDGNFRFVVLMDKLHSQLKDLIVFINQNSKFDIFGIELEYYKYQDYEIMIPKLFGSEVKKDLTSTGTRKKWDEESFFKDAKEKLKESELKSVKILYEFSKDKADQVSWGTGATRGSFNPKFWKISIRSLYSVFSNGILRINFGWLNDNESTEKYRDNFKRKLEKLKGFSIPNDYQGEYVDFSAKEWVPRVDSFIKIVRDLISN
jgi:hypothetical protein